MTRNAPSSPPSAPPIDAVVIRRAYPDDAAALARLAALDGRRPLSGAVILAERGGAAVAALSVADGRTAADPFVPTADLVALLRVHAADAARSGGRPDTILRRRGASFRRRPALARG